MRIHTVAKGDTIYSIARTYGVPPSRIITDNLLTDPGRLAVGEDLVILYPTVVYTVRGGDTLASIANRFDVPMLTLYRNNPQLSGSPAIFPGQVLNIAYDTPQLGPILTNGYAYTSIDPTILRQTLPYLTYLSVFHTGIASDGQLLPPVGERALIDAAREYGTIPLLVLTSLTEDGTFSSQRAAQVVTDPALGNRVIQEAVEAVRTLGYGGVDVDFEYIPAEAAAGYGDFLARLRDGLGADGEVFVSLAPKTASNQRGLLYEGHDYPTLGTAADRALVMTYEWGYTYGPPLAVSPLPEVRRVLDYAVTVIPREKLFMGVPNYGYDWPLPYEQGVTKARSLGNRAAVDQALAKNAAIEYDELAQAPYYRYYDRPETWRDAVEHVVWFENARSALAQTALVREYGLGGMGVWNIMRFFPGLWQVVNSRYEIQKLV